MSKYIFDYDDGDFAMSISDSMAMDSEGNLMMRMGDHIAMDMDTGDIHMISSWTDVYKRQVYDRRKWIFCFLRMETRQSGCKKAINRLDFCTNAGN